MKYPYIVNKDGVWYPAGTEVPEGTSSIAKESKDDNLTKTDINRMTTAELKELAEKEEIEGFEEMTGGELKKVLIEKFGL